MAGVTNPAKASPNSIRGRLYRSSEQLGPAEVSSGVEWIHVSAGPLEGMIELVRYMSDQDRASRLTYEQTTFGKLLRTWATTDDLLTLRPIQPYR